MLKPAKIKDEETGQEKTVEVLIGFKSAPVFAVESTEGKALPAVDDTLLQWINAVPLVEVARAWGLRVEVYNGQNSGALGHFSAGRAIGLGVQNLSTWAHELIHAADHRLGQLKERGQHWRSETVAELGGAILLECLGYVAESDRGGCWAYIEKYANEAGIEPLAACMDTLKRTCEAVNLLLREAGKHALAVTLSPHSRSAGIDSQAGLRARRAIARHDD